MQESQLDDPKTFGPELSQDNDGHGNNGQDHQHGNYRPPQIIRMWSTVSRTVRALLCHSQAPLSLKQNIGNHIWQAQPTSSILFNVFNLLKVPTLRSNGRI